MSAAAGSSRRGRVLNRIVRQNQTNVFPAGWYLGFSANRSGSLKKKKRKPPILSAILDRPESGMFSWVSMEEAVGTEKRSSCEGPPMEAASKSNAA